jgi:hypothetical protein
MHPIYWFVDRRPNIKFYHISSPRTIARFLEWAFEVTKASLQRAEDEVFDKDSGRKYIVM